MIISSSQSGGRADEDDDEAVKRSWKEGRNEGTMSWPWKLCCAILYMLPWVSAEEEQQLLMLLLLLPLLLLPLLLLLLPRLLPLHPWIQHAQLSINPLLAFGL